MVLTKARSAGRYLRNRSWPSLSMTSSRGSSGSFEVIRLMTDESSVKKLPLGVVLLKISAKNRGLGVLSESQQGTRKATGWLPGTLFSKSTHRSNVDLALAKSFP